MKFVGPESLRSSAYAYKGLTHELMGRANDQNISKVGIMAGKDDAVIEVCVGDDVSTILSSDEMNNPLEEVGLRNHGSCGLESWVYYFIQIRGGYGKTCVDQRQTVFADGLLCDR